MRRLVLFVLLLLPALAVAAPVCIPGFYGTTLDVGAPKRDEIGWRVSWVCRDSAGQPRAQWLVCEHATACDWYKTADVVAAATRAADPVAAIRSAWTAFVTGASYATATGDLRTLHDRAAADGGELVAAYLARTPAPTPPPVAVWKVAVNSKYPDRPTYAWVSGARSTAAAAERVKVGEPCDPAVGTVTTSSTGSYLGVLGRADRVALCRKQ